MAWTTLFRVRRDGPKAPRRRAGLRRLPSNTLRYPGEADNGLARERPPLGRPAPELGSQGP